MHRRLTLLKFGCWLFWLSLAAFVLLGSRVGPSAKLDVVTAGVALTAGLSLIVAIVGLYLLGTPDGTTSRQDWSVQHRRIRIGAELLTIVALLGVTHALTRFPAPFTAVFAILEFLFGLGGFAILGYQVPRLLERLQRQAGFHRADATLALVFVACALTGASTTAVFVLLDALPGNSSRTPAGIGSFACLASGAALAGLAAILSIHLLATQAARCMRFATRA